MSQNPLTSINCFAFWRHSCPKKKNQYPRIRPSDIARQQKTPVRKTGVFCCLLLSLNKNHIRLNRSLLHEGFLCFAQTESLRSRLRFLRSNSDCRNKRQIRTDYPISREPGVSESRLKRRSDEMNEQRRFVKNAAANDMQSAPT